MAINISNLIKNFIQFIAEYTQSELTQLRMYVFRPDFPLSFPFSRWNFRFWLKISEEANGKSFLTKNVLRPTIYSEIVYRLMALK